MSNIQEFIFPLNVWDTVIQNLDHDSWKNLSSTCKFFNNYKIVHIKELKIVPNDGNQVKLRPTMQNVRLRADNENIKKFYISQKFHSSTRRPLSSILSKIIKCDLTELRIEYNDLTWNEYILLTSGGKIKVLSLEGVNIKYSNNAMAPLEDIMSRLPNANDLFIQPCHCTEDTIQNLKCLPRNVKIKSLCFAEIDRRIYAHEIFDYCKDVLRPKSYLVVTFTRLLWDSKEFSYPFVTEMKNFANEFEWIVFNDQRPAAFSLLNRHNVVFACRFSPSFYSDKIFFTAAPSIFHLLSSSVFRSTAVLGKGNVLQNKMDNARVDPPPFNNPLFFDEDPPPPPNNNNNNLESLMLHLNNNILGNAYSNFVAVAGQKQFRCELTAANLKQIMVQKGGCSNKCKEVELYSDALYKTQFVYKIQNGTGVVGASVYKEIDFQKNLCSANIHYITNGSAKYYGNIIPREVFADVISQNGHMEIVADVNNPEEPTWDENSDDDELPTDI